MYKSSIKKPNYVLKVVLNKDLRFYYLNLIILLLYFNSVRCNVQYSQSKCIFFLFCHKTFVFYFHIYLFLYIFI